MKTIFIFLLGLSFFACRTLPIEMSEDEVLGEPIEDAEFPGGYAKMQAYIANNLNRPAPQDSFDRSNTSCKVYVLFEIDSLGAIRNPLVEKSTGNCLPCEKEALRLVQNMPKWTPAKMNGLPIVSQVRLPLTFTF
ncbi:MAG: hypothetical protein RLZZ301_77 [Bacteroidota bacterium]|jgi:hypothetical protein